MASGNPSAEIELADQAQSGVGPAKVTRSGRMDPPPRGKVVPNLAQYPPRQTIRHSVNRASDQIASYSRDSETALRASAAPPWLRRASLAIALAIRVCTAEAGWEIRFTADSDPGGLAVLDGIMD
jgi:hypothetical protein